MEKLLFFVNRISLDDIIQSIENNPTITIIEKKSRKIELRVNSQISMVKKEHILYFSKTMSEMLLKLRKKYFNMVIVDERLANVDTERLDFQEVLIPLLNNIEKEPNPDKQYSFNRVLVLLDDTSDLPDRVFELGKLQIGTYLTRPFEDNRLFKKIEHHLHRTRKTGKTALCIAGGGLEGLLYELGVLRALNSLFKNFKVTDFDIFTGISSGAYIGSILANNIQPEEFISAFEGESSVFGPITSKVIYDLNLPEYAVTLFSFWRNMARFSANLTPNVFASIIKAFPNGICKGEKMREFLRDQLTKRGLTDDFRKLTKELYIGATNMDTFNHVVFGNTGWRDVPISTAVRASSAMVPVYSPARIGNAWYIDGAFTHTTNLELAVKKGAHLIIVIDPVVPLKIEKPGYVAKKGGIFSTIQGVKGLISTRFDRTYKFLKKQYPDVDFYIFRPKGEEMRLLSGSPMKYKIRLGIVALAYETTINRIMEDFEIFQKGFHKHGIELTKKVVKEEGEKLRSGDINAIKTMLERSPEYQNNNLFSSPSSDSPQRTFNLDIFD